MIDTLVGLILDEHYELLSEVGRGALGVVYKARQVDTELPVAVKLLFQDMIHDDTAFERFSSEAESVCSLEHPNIVHVFDFGLTDFGYAYFVMDFLEGQNLQSILDKEGRLPIKRALKIFAQICDALSHAHSKNIMHNDIKPENIIIQKDEANADQIKVVDFGLARKFRGIAGMKANNSGEIMGSPAYMSPEQCMGKTNPDARSDIYSLGCLMYATLTGVLPICGTDAMDTMSKHIGMVPPPLSVACPGALIPVNVQEVVMKTLKKFPEERYQTMQKLKQDLNALLK